jgi:hypothetical protein
VSQISRPASSQLHRRLVPALSVTIALAGMAAERPWSAIGGGHPPVASASEADVGHVLNMAAAPRSTAAPTPDVNVVAPVTVPVPAAPHAEEGTRETRVELVNREMPAIDVAGAATAPATASLLPKAVPLLARGEAMLAVGDIVAARLFFDRAVQLGSGRAATFLGQTYDAAYLASIRASGVRPDRELAAFWYRKGSALGDEEATRRLSLLPAR